ncbi:MAG TPA: DUF1800 family protein [Candidatus Saccharimonadales bacterium]|nr:DUF1800 family protein [Candidatus Saccharimonadales bacterium]
MSPAQRPAAERSLLDCNFKSCGAVFLSLVCFFSLGLDPPAAAVPLAARGKKSRPDPVLKGLPPMDLSADEAILHALNRLSYGPRPGDVQRVKQIGLAKWIELQLNADSIDDRRLESRLENLPTLRLSTAQLIEQYPRPKAAAQQALIQSPTRTPSAAAVVGNGSGALQTAVPAIPAMPADEPANPARNSDNSSGTSSMKEIPQADANAANRATTGSGKRNFLTGADPNAVPKNIADDSKRPQRVVEELAMAKVARAIYSERQLQQIMDDFWFNHFNVYAGKGDDKWYLTSYERDVIQPHTFGKFKDLVLATATSPSMLFYLDNYLSADPRAAERQAVERALRQNRGYGRPRSPANPQPAAKKKKGRGLNENYGRELMELHTLGVDGGYSQKDVTEVARCFTGWTIDKPRQYAAFNFDERLHDPDPKIVLGKKIHAGGMKDGEQVIELLARNPSTARFIATKLARRFVSDDPPPALVNRMAKTFTDSDGDIRSVLHTMIFSPEFWSRESYRAKIKTPYELVISSVRALGADVDTPMPLVQWVARIGEPLYQCQPPTGFADKADAWVNAGALLNRLNFSLALAGNKIRGSRTDVAALLGVDAPDDARIALDRAVQAFLGGQIAPATIETLQKELETPQVRQAKLDDPVRQVDLGVVTGMVLGAPEFQRR